MTSALDRLSVRVRQAESQFRAGALRAEASQAAETLRAAEDLLCIVEKRLREEERGHKTALTDAEADKVHLETLTHKIAELVATGDISPKQLRAMAAECDMCRKEIEQVQGRAVTELAALMLNVTQAKQTLQAAIASYVRLRDEVDELQPDLAPDFVEDDRMAQSAALLLPAGQLYALASELQAAPTNFATLGPNEQLAQLKVWIGRYRRLQASGDAHFSENERALRRRLFPRLVALSKQYEPGYIEAFRIGFEADWDAYIAAAEEQLRLASENIRIRRHQQEIEIHNLIAKSTKKLSL